MHSLRIDSRRAVVTRGQGSSGETNYPMAPTRRVEPLPNRKKRLVPAYGVSVSKQCELNSPILLQII